MGQIDAADFDSKENHIVQTALEQTFFSGRRSCRAGRLVIDGNSVYEIDEECIQQKGKQIHFGENGMLPTLPPE